MAEHAITESPNIHSVLVEKRTFAPPPEYSRNSYVKSMDEYRRLYKAAEEDPEKFWSDIARELHWFAPWTKVLEWNLPWAKWFVGGKINLSYNCLDRHMSTARRTKTAIIWEGEPGEVRTLTYEQLLKEVSKLANALKALGIKTGDRVALYMGLTPELA
ncbi:MAG TPA: acetyl-coenzyme A synthetase N-terminal domain-containing protein, partial [Terriglobales bacterium]